MSITSCPHLLQCHFAESRLHENGTLAVHLDELTRSLVGRVDEYS